MPSTRREVLAATATGLALLAGCSGSDRSSQPVPGDSGEPIEYDAVKVRVPDGPVPFTRRVEDGDSTRTIGPDRFRESELLVTSAELDAFDFAETEAGERIRLFAEETDFERETLYLQGTAIGECYERRLQSVRQQPDGDPDFQFCRAVRPADVACSEDETVALAFAIRLAISGEDVTGYGSGSGSCDRPSRPPSFDATVAIDAEGTER